MVSAPTIVPMARPRRVIVPLAAGANQVAIIFMAGGYTPARKKPVKKRSTSATAKVGATSSIQLTDDASSAQVGKDQRAGARSARLSRAATAVPATNPS